MADEERLRPNAKGREAQRAAQTRGHRQNALLHQRERDAGLPGADHGAVRDRLHPPERPNVWVVPWALPDEQPTGTAEFARVADATQLRYSYQTLSEGLVPRAIVRLHDFIEGSGKSAKRWASGAILTRDGARALQDRQVMVTVTGLDDARRKLAGLCQAELRDIHDGIVVSIRWRKPRYVEPGSRPPLWKPTNAAAGSRGSPLVLNPVWLDCQKI